MQRERYAGAATAGTPVRTNAEADGALLDRVAMRDESGRRLLAHAVERMRLSARGYHRVLRVARTLVRTSAALETQGIDFPRDWHRAACYGASETPRRLKEGDLGRAPERVARVVAAWTLARFFSDAASRSSRLRARSAARAGLRQTTSRSPGKSGELISAMSRSSNSDSCSGPSSTANAWMAGARSAVIQSSPAGFSSASILAL